MAEEERVEEKKVRVRVLRRAEISVFPTLGEERKYVLVVYAAEGMPPATVQIPAEEYSPERELEAIKEDLKRRIEERGEEFEIPL